LVGVTSVALIALFIALMTGKLGRSKLVTVSGTMILAGGIGNLIDRVFRHEVIDFFYFKAINFAIFNVADCFVVVGASLMLIYFLFIYKEEKKPDAQELAPAEEAAREGDAADGDADAKSFAGNDRGEA
jgi:signal peptidase II